MVLTEESDILVVPPVSSLVIIKKLFIFVEFFQFWEELEKKSFIYLFDKSLDELFPSLD